MILTDEQKQLTTENHQLIYWFLNKYGLEIEEYYDLAAIGLCKAAGTYREEVGKFSTYSCKCMYHEVFNDIQHENRQKKIPDSLIFSYNTPVLGCEDDEMEMLDCLEGNFNLENEVFGGILYEKLMTRLPDKYKMTLILSLKGYNTCEIGVILGCSQSYICQIKKKIGVILGEI